MKKYYFLFIALTVLLLVIPVPVFGQSLGLPSDVAYILIDSRTGQVIAEQNADQRLRPASTTKIMTAIVAMENGDLTEEMSVSQAAVFDIGKGGMNVGIMAGEEGLTLDHMLNILLIKSANETANIIAENISSSRTEFMKLVNQRAHELGAVNTTFMNPSGKDTEKEDEGHLTTPRDMSIMARHAMTIPKFREIVATEYYKGMPVTNKHDDWGILRNTNQFLWYDNTYPYSLEDGDHKYTVIGMKTGYTFQAGNNLITAAVGEDGMELIAVVMHVMQPNKIYGYSKELMRYGFENYSMQVLSEAGQTVDTVAVEGADDSGTLLELVTETGFSSALPIGMSSQDIETKISLKGPISAPVQKGEVMGSIEYLKDNVSIGKVNIIASQTILPALSDSGTASAVALSSKQEPPYSYMILGILLLLSGLVILRITLRKLSRKIKKKRYEQKYHD